MKIFLIFLFSLSIIIFLFSSKPVSADLMNPEYYNKKCYPGEFEIQCNWESELPFGPATYDECLKYKYNPSYRYLVSEGHSFGGKVKYCYKPISTIEVIKYHLKTLLPLIILTLLIEIPLFLKMISKTRKVLITVLIANLISVSLLYLATLFWPFTSLNLLIVMELVVIIFETIFLKLIFKNISLNKILVYTIIANTLSLVIGTIIFSFFKTFIISILSLIYMSFGNNFYLNFVDPFIGILAS